MRSKATGQLVKGMLTRKMLAKLSPRTENAVIPMDDTILREVLSFQSQSLQLHLSLHRLEAALEAASASAHSVPPQEVTVPYECSFLSLQRLVANIVAHDSRAKKMKGKFSIDLKFYKDSDQAWVPMNTELQWLHAKSCALDLPGNAIKILYGAVNQSDVVRPRADCSLEDDRLLLELKNKLNVNLHHNPDLSSSTGLDANVSFHSMESAGELSGAGGSIHKGFGGSTSMLFNDSISSSGAGKRVALIRNNKEKQNKLAKNLEKRLIKSAK